MDLFVTYIRFFILALLRVLLDLELVVLRVLVIIIVLVAGLGRLLKRVQVLTVATIGAHTHVWSLRRLC